MLKRVFSAVMFILLLTSMLTLAFNTVLVKAEPRVWIVDDDGPADFHTIGEAITAAANGDTIFVRNGTYNEHIAMYDKFNMRILGEDNNYTIIDGNGVGPIVTIFEGSNVTFANFTVRNAGNTMGIDEAIRLRYTSSNTIANCIITGCGFGIFEQEYYDFGGRNTIIGNTVSDCTEIAIGSTWEYLVGDVVANNTITNSTNVGIYFNSAYNVQIIGNTITNSTNFGILFNSASDVQVLGNTITNSTNGIYSNNPYNVQILGNHILGTESQYSQYGIHLQVGGLNNTIIGNRVEYSENAIRLDYADNNVVEENNVKNCIYGVFVGYESSNNIIVGNNASGCSIGFMLWDNSNNNLVTNNLATDNGIGIALSASNSNRIYHNNFINNSQQVLSDESQPNVWDNGYPSGGNFWSDYMGTDADYDGIGDTPYIIDVNNTDNYPLMNSYQPSHDIAITDTLTIKTVVGQGYSLNLTVTAANQGDCVETFNVTIYANTTSIASQNISLPSLISSNITTTLNTTGLAYGNYTLNAYAYPVPGETNTINNNYTCDTSIHIGVPADVSGPTQGVYDGQCNMRDIQYLILYFNTNPSSQRWKPNADINNDGTVNMRDITIAILHFNQHE